MKKYLVLLLCQFLSVFLLQLIGYIARPVNVLYVLFVYAIVPLFASFSAGWLVIRGINSYLAWILPPVAIAFAAFLSTLGIGQSPLPMMISAFVSLVGAATGDTILKFRKKGKK